jgi:hypothetical protein
MIAMLDFDEHRPDVGPPMISCDSAGGASPKRVTARAKIFCVASADSGVVSDVSDHGSPQTNASAAFQHHGATGS